MKPKYPKRIPILHDDYHAKHIGQTVGGHQFLLTTPFVPGRAEFIALYLFDVEGKFLESKIINLGNREKLSDEEAKKRYEVLLNSLGVVTFQDIFIEPFEIEFEGFKFGLVPVNPDFVEDEEDLSLEIQPGNYMAFFPPWDGEYDT